MDEKNTKDLTNKIDSVSDIKKDPTAALNNLKDLSMQKIGASDSSESKPQQTDKSEDIGDKAARGVGTIGAGTAGSFAGATAGQAAGETAGKEAGEEAGEKAADALVDAGKEMVGNAVENVPLVGGMLRGGTDALADAAKKPAEDLGRAVGGAAGKAAGGAAGSAAGSAAGGKGAAAAADAAMRGQGGQSSDDDDDLGDKMIKKGTKDGINAAKNAQKLQHAADALNPANLAAKATAMAVNGAKGLLSAGVQLVKNLGAAAYNGIVGAAKAVGAALGKAIGSVASFLGHAGITGVAATAIASTAVIGGSVGIPVVLGTAIYTELHQKPDDWLVCAPNADTSDDSSDSSASDGTTVDMSEAQKKEEAKIISVLHVAGYTDVQIAGVISNWMAEGSLDSSLLQQTPYEGVNWGTEGNAYMNINNQSGQLKYPYQNTKEKTAALKWASEHPSESKLNGVGLGQMTPAAPYYDWSVSAGKDWSDPGIQMAYQMSSVSNGKYPWGTFKEKTKDITDPTAMAAWFYYGWEYPGYQGSASNAPSGVVKFEAVHTKYATQALADVKATKVDESYGKSVMALVDSTIEGGAQGSTSNSDSSESSNNTITDPCDDNGATEEDTTKAEDGTGEVPVEAIGKYYEPQNVPDSLKKFIQIDPAQYGLEYGTWKGWEAAGALLGYSNPGIMTTCTQLSAALGYKLYGIQNVMGNGYEVVGNWAKLDTKGKVSSTPKVGAIFSYSPGGGKGKNHTGIVSHVFANGDILAVETGIGLTPGGNTPDLNSGTWDYHVYTKATMDKLSASYFIPSKEMAKPTGSNFFG